MSSKHADFVAFTNAVDRYTTALQGRLQGGATAADACRQIADEAIAETTSSLSHVSYAAAFHLAVEAPGLGEVLLARVQEARGRPANIMASYLCLFQSQTPGLLPVDREAWLRAWWAAASTGDKLSFLKNALASRRRLSGWRFCIEAADDEDPVISSAAIELLDQKMERICSESDRPLFLNMIALRLPQWLQDFGQVKQEKATRLLLRHAMEMRQNLGDELVPFALALLETFKAAPVTSPPERNRILGEAAHLMREALHSNAPRSGEFLAAVMDTPMNQPTLLALLLPIMPSIEGVDLASFVPEEQRPALRRWLTESIGKSDLVHTIDVFTTWAKTDPSGFLRHEESILNVFSGAGSNGVTQAAAVVVTLVPGEFASRLLEEMKHQRDELFLPIVAAAAQRHTNAIAPDIFERLLGSRDGRYRAIATISLESMAESPETEQGAREVPEQALDLGRPGQQTSGDIANRTPVAPGR